MWSVPEPAKVRVRQKIALRLADKAGRRRGDSVAPLTHGEPRRVLISRPPHLALYPETQARDGRAPRPFVARPKGPPFRLGFSPASRGPIV